MNEYSEAEMNYFKEFERNNAHSMTEFSKEGGLPKCLKFLGLAHFEANSAIIKWYAQFHELSYSRI